MNKQFKNYKQAIEAAFPDIIGEDGFDEPNSEGLDILRDVDEKQLLQIFSDARSLPHFKILTRQAHLAAIEQEKGKQEEWREQQLQERFEEQEQMDEVYAKATVDGDIWNLKTEAAQIIDPATSDQISKVLDESIGGHGYWLVNHRDFIEKIIANRIEEVGISQTMMDVGHSWLRSEDEPYSDLELDMYEVIAKYNGDIDKEGMMTKTSDIYTAINRRIRENDLNQFKNYKEAIEAAYPDIMGDDGFLEPDFDGMDVLKYVDENKLSQIFTESNTLDEFKTNTKQALKEEEIKSQKEWQEQQDQYWQEQFEEQEKTDEIYANATVDGDIWNINPEWSADSKIKEIDSDLITKTLEKQTPEQNKLETDLDMEMF